MKMFRSYRVRVVAVAFGLGVLAVGLSAQEKAHEAAAPSAAEAKLANIEVQIAALVKQVQQLSSAPVQAPSVDRVREAYTDSFKKAKDQAGPGCKAAGGRLRVLVDSAGKIAVSCEW